MFDAEFKIFCNDEKQEKLLKRYLINYYYRKRQFLGNITPPKSKLRIRLLSAVDNVDKLGLQRSTTNQEAVDILLGVQLVTVGRSSRATIDNTGLVGHGVRNVLREPATDLRVCFLGLLRRCSDASTNSPDRLVGNNNLLPVSLRQGGLNGFKLLSANLHRATVLSIRKLLADANDHAQSGVDGVLGLNADHVASLTRETEANSALTVASQSPLNARISKHFSRMFTGEGTISLLETNVFSADSNIGADKTLQSVKMQSRGSDNNLGKREDRGKKYTYLQWKYFRDIRPRTSEFALKVPALLRTSAICLMLATVPLHFQLPPIKALAIFPLMFKFASNYKNDCFVNLW